jgi:hypothetical protein
VEEEAVVASVGGIPVSHSQTHWVTRALSRGHGYQIRFLLSTPSLAQKLGNKDTNVQALLITNVAAIWRCSCITIPTNVPEEHVENVDVDSHRWI